MLGKKLLKADVAMDGEMTMIGADFLIDQGG